MSGESDIHLEDVSKRFGDTLAVDRLTLSIERGEFFTMLGPSGCGKTTTLRMIGGFEDPTAGRVFLGGEEVTQQPPYKRDVNTVFQSYALFPHLSVEKNVGFGLERKRVGRDELRRRVDEALERVELSDLRDRQIGELSGGQRKRAFVARGLAQGAELLFLDEPFAGVDPASAERMSSLFGELCAEGRTLLLSTHDVQSARSFDLVLCLNGRQVAFGDPAASLGREVLEATYGSELVVLEDGDEPLRAVTVQHHEH